MSNNILGLDLKVDQEYIKKCVKDVVNASMVDALGAKNDIVEVVVKELLNTKVDRHGEITSSYNGEKIIDYELKKQIRDVVKETIQKVIEEKRPTLEEMIKKELSKRANLNKFVDSFINNTTKTLENSYHTTINIEFEKENVYE